MKNESPISEAEVPTGTAVAVYGQGSPVEDFPVLKAFQEYIDAEQAKARKRLTVICILFGFLMLLVIAVFMFMLQSANSRGQQMNEKLLDMIASRENRVEPHRVRASAADLEAENLQAELRELRRQLSAQSSAPNIQPQSVAPVAVPPASSVSDQIEILKAKAELERQKQAMQEAERERIQNEKLQAEQRKLAEKEEELRKKERDLFLRRQYPHCYDAEGRLIPREQRLTPTAERQTVPSPKPARHSLAPLSLTEATDAAATPSATTFNEKEGSCRISVDVEGKATDWEIPLD